MKSFSSGYKALLAAIGVTLLIGAWLLWSHVPVEPSSSARVQATPAPIVAQQAQPVPPPQPVMAGTPVPAPSLLVPVANAFTTLEDYRQRRAAAPHTLPPAVPSPAGRTPENELGRVTFLVGDYRAAFGSNPVGSNKEITRALLGDNERGTKFVDPSTVTLNAKGEMLDAWGHPYFFHAMSGKLMEIRSAGPDGRIFTADDLVR